MTKRIAVYGHRGASAYEIENTFEAFEKALQLGADGIELDIQCSQDQQLFVFHDLDLVRLTGVRKLITESTATELLRYNLARGIWRKWKKRHIPPFEEVLKWANARQVPLNIELKESLVDCLQPLIELLQRYPLPEGSHVSSFLEAPLAELKKRLPHIETALLVTKKFDWQRLPQMPHIDAVHAHKKYYERRFLKAVEIAGKPIRFYAIDGSEVFLQQPHPSVAGWITDYPDRLKKIEHARLK